MKNITLLKDLIKTPSFSGEENKTGDLIQEYFKEYGVKTQRWDNNIIAIHPDYDEKKKTVLLNSHHDTVKVNDGWTEDPFGAKMEGDTLYGLGSNDAGASLVSLIQTFIHYHNKTIPYNLVIAATGEEENFGPNGLASVLYNQLPKIDLGIIGEPTSLELGVAQKGLIVIDAQVKGKAGHAARNNGINAIYEALDDLTWIASYAFPKMSPHLGPTTIQATLINAGIQHNIIPDLCTYVIDARVNDCYSNEEVITILRDHLKAEIKPRSMRWQSKGIAMDHPIVKKAQSMGIRAMGSPTLSDQVHCNFPSVKIGPGDSNRSHTANEYIKLSEVKAGTQLYIDLLSDLEL